MNLDWKMNRFGILFTLGVLLVIFMLIAAYIRFEESDCEKYATNIKPGVVHYGSPCTAIMPDLSFSVQHRSAPMISGGDVQAFAHYGHASMPMMTSGTSFRTHTFSSATVHTVGSGGGGGGHTVSTNNSTSSSSRGINPSVGTFSMPTLAIVTTTRNSDKNTFSATAKRAYVPSEHTSAPRRGISARRLPGYPGEEEGDEVTDGDGTWMWDGEQWTLIGGIPVGTTKIDGGITYQWNGSSWEIVGNQQDPGLPLGDTPWVWMILLMVAYGATKSWRKTTDHTKDSKI